MNPKTASPAGVEPRLALHLLWLRARAPSGRGRASQVSKRILHAMKDPTLHRLAHNVTIVRMVLAVGWIAMVALLSLLAMILDGKYF